jgi:hypothetical protein
LAVGTWLRWGKAKVKGWEAEIKRRAGGGWIWVKMPKTELPGLVFCERIAGGVVFGLGRHDLCGVNRV